MLSIFFSSFFPLSERTPEAECQAFEEEIGLLGETRQLSRIRPSKAKGDQILAKVPFNRKMSETILRECPRLVKPEHKYDLTSNWKTPLLDFAKAALQVRKRDNFFLDN